MRVLLETYGAARAVKKVTEQDIAWLEDNVRGAETALALGLPRWHHSAQLPVPPLHRRYRRK